MPPSRMLTIPCHSLFWSACILVCLIPNCISALLGMLKRVRSHHSHPLLHGTCLPLQSQRKDNEHDSRLGLYFCHRSSALGKADGHGRVDGPQDYPVIPSGEENTSKAS